ncbi:unnamed protein product [Timema podura]|uniref:Single domain-containing protein n=1 Tax=Timema podura TaxID=61482 RepID=A0ABN7P8A5_TIMPD|nr:unnamed protein product [Timema podura]
MLISTAAVFVIGQPEKIKPAFTCYDSDLKENFEEGQTWTNKEKGCVEFLCGASNGVAEIYTQICPEIGIRKSKYCWNQEDLEADFPRCCPMTVCS